MNYNQDISSKLPEPVRDSLFDSLDNLNEYKLEFLKNCSREYHELIPLQIGQIQAILLNCPNYIEQIFKDRKIFTMSPDVRVHLQRLLGEGILLKEGDLWLRQRRMNQPIFQQKQIINYADTVVECVKCMLDTWQHDEIRDIQPDMLRLTLKIIWKIIFNQYLTNEEAQDIEYVLAKTTGFLENKDSEKFNNREPASIPEDLHYESILKQMDGYIYSHIKQRRQNTEYSDDLVSMLIQASYEDGSQMSDKQVRDEVVNLILAGQEAVAVALSWTFILLSLHPQSQTRLLAELNEVLENHSPSIADLPRLSYTDWVIKESMRLYPPIPIMIISTNEDYEIGGYKVPANYPFIISAWTMHRHPQYFKEPDTFNPERWSDSLEKQLPKGTYFPFGEGSRICLGKYFAQMLIVLIISTIIQEYELKLIPNFQLILWSTLTLRSKEGVPVILKKRNKF
ncbi:cytochrome P450 [Nostoc sp. C117]|uniref:cytochrome P450 n=1 Tax=Nostoc sp. C117 TaxID=3349875 RepID=UPI00370D5EC2